MLTANSRYYNLASTSFVTPEGKTITYKKRRFLPQANKLNQAAEITIKEGDRFDQIANRVLGEPLNYWQIADANNTMNPHTRIQEVGTSLKVSTFNFGSTI